MKYSRKIIQAKNVPDRDILVELIKMDGPASSWKILKGEWPEKIILAKLRSLERRGLIDGCGCGCSGGWTIKEKGRERLK